MTALIGRLLGCGFEADTVTTPLQGLKSPTDAPILALRVVVTSAGLLIGPPVGEHEPDGRVPTLPHFILQGGRQPMMIGGPYRGPPFLRPLDRAGDRRRRRDATALGREGHPVPRLEHALRRAGRGNKAVGHP